MSEVKVGDRVLVTDAENHWRSGERGEVLRTGASLAAVRLDGRGDEDYFYPRELEVLSE